MILKYLVVHLVTMVASLLISLLSFLSPIINPDEQKADTVSIPFIRSGNLLLTQGQVNNHEGYFIIDTGAPSLVLNKKYAESSSLVQERVSLNANGSSFETYRTTAKNFRIGNLNNKRVQAYASDLTNIEKSRDITLLGLVGLKTFFAYSVTIDSRKGMIILTKRAKSLNRLLDKEDVRIIFSLSSKKMFLNSIFNGKKCQLQFDTGAETCTINRTLIKKHPEQFQLQGYQRLLTASGKIGTSQRGVLKQLSVGNLQFTNLNVLVTNIGSSHNNSRLTFHGAIGSEILSIGIVHIDFRSKELVIHPYNPATEHSFQKSIQ